MKVIARGIDVSVHNGSLNWEKIKPQIDFAIIRAGFGMNIKSQDDAYFEYNSSECLRLGIPFGVYLYSYATSVANAESEARHILRLMENKACAYPIYYDLEDEGTLGKKTNKEIEQIAETFCNILESEGYFVGIYANLHWFRTRLNSTIYNRWTRWLAQYNKTLTYDGNVGMWQHTNKGRLEGCSGYFDFNECFVDFPKIIVEGGFNNNAKDTFVPQKGDVDGDGSITAADARLALRAAARLEDLTEDQMQRADMDGDGKVTAADARIILRIAAGLIDDDLTDDDLINDDLIENDLIDDDIIENDPGKDDLGESHQTDEGSETEKNTDSTQGIESVENNENLKDLENGEGGEKPEEG